MQNLLLLICLVAACTATYTITYTGYKDGTCTQVDNAVTGEIFAYKCAIEYRVPQSFQTGKITYVDDDYLISCDYSDMACANQTICQKYYNNKCNLEWKDTTGTSFFSSQYSWTKDTNGNYQITYSSFKDDACTTTDVSGQVSQNVCAAEYRDPSPPQSGQITFINDEYLTSCDYSDGSCTAQAICVNYTNNACSDSWESFSDKYSWTTATSDAPTDAPTNMPTSAPVTDAPTSAPNPTNAPATSAPSPSSDYYIMYTAYTDKSCSSVDSSHTGEIFAYKCVAEDRTVSASSGQITQITKDWLISCDYTDLECNTVKVCVNYTNNVCYASSTSLFSNSYVWSEDSTAENGWKIMYNSYTDQKCLALNNQQTGQIFYNKCAQEYDTTPQSGMITFINDLYLTSCDYSDDQCSQVTVCENYTNSICYGSQVVSFSNKYSWWVSGSINTPVTTSKPTSPATVPSGSESQAHDDSDYLIYYSAYTDNTCTSLDNAMSGQIFAHTCSLEYDNKVPASGKITAINSTHLMSCDYSDTQCATQTDCEMYANAYCYSSGSSKFSNKYLWFANGDGTWTITYTSYKDNQCGLTDVSGQIFYDVCAPEFRSVPRSGQITYINDDYLTSCDYSDTKCQTSINCVNYTNAECSDSATTSFSDKYSWTRNTKASPASAVAASLFVVSFALAFALF